MDRTEVETANKCKDKGNVLFKKGKYEEALKQYADAIIAVDSQIMNPAEQLKTLCLLNMAVILRIPTPALLHTQFCLQAVNLKLERWEDAVSNCDGALKLDEKSLKAFLRRSQAFIKLGRITKARDDLKVALSIESDCQVLVARHL
jgi:tetratricopeptide (TPR) repeat protein